jgi:tryptophan halogenase
MAKKRIAVVGKGTAGSQAASHFNRFFPEAEIVWYFDSKKPVQSVGEGSTLELPVNLYNNIGFFNTDLPKINGTFKTGIYKENWGKRGNNFFHDFPPPQASYHFSAVELQDYIFNYLKNKIRIEDKNVDYKNLDADFVFNASGRPENFDNFHISEYIPVNAAHVVQCNWDYPRFDYTLAIAKPHGWIFGIPLQNRCSIGYIYNSDISSVEDLQKDMEDVFEEYGLTPSSDPNNLKFNNYYKKQNYELSGRIVHSGNASFFLEPLEATSIGTMDRVQRAAFDVWNGFKKAEVANKEYQDFMDKTELVIMLHYFAGSAFDTEFWRYAKEKAEKKIKGVAKDDHFKEICNIANQVSEMRYSPNSSNFPEYGPWWSGAFVQNFYGLGILDELNKIIR